CPSSAPTSLSAEPITQIIQANETYVLTAYTESSAAFPGCRWPGLGIYWSEGNDLWGSCCGKERD
ncbi:MAG: hypothetical protein AVDCRST_MAG58-3633, partial [uncultured Rubrobacteraceae bacterium]